MSTRLKAALEANIDAWINAECEADDWPSDFWTHDEMAEQMAEAAYQVFTASVKGQIFARENEK